MKTTIFAGEHEWFFCLLFQGATDWLGKDDEPLTGFSWRGGSERETTGIWAWNKLFICEIVEGEEVSLLTDRLTYVRC